MIALPPNYRRNFAAILGDYIGFGLAMTFISLTTVLPVFVSQLTDSEIAVGLLSTIASGAWLLPQLVYANILTNKRRKKPYVTLSALLGRPGVLLYGIALLFGLHHNPSLTLILLFCTLILLFVTDAMAAIAWFDVVAKAIPDNRRGRLMGAGQVIRGILATGIGAFIAFLLGENGPMFPNNYALLFVLGGVFLLLSLLSWSFSIEPDEQVEDKRTLWRDYIPQLRETLRMDGTFRRLLIVRVLSGFDQLAIGFYILFARHEMGLPAETIGLFTFVQTVGSIVSGLGLAVVNERAGSQRVIRITTALALTAPLVALSIFLIGTPSVVMITALCAWIFLAVGAVQSSVLLGHYNYVLELAPAGKRPTYMGLFNTISGILVILPTLGGWLLETTSYSTLFILTAGFLAASHVLSLSLPSARRSVMPQEEPAG
jgi:MFS family permease